MAAEKKMALDLIHLHSVTYAGDDEDDTGRGDAAHGAPVGVVDGQTGAGGAKRTQQIG